MNVKKLTIYVFIPVALSSLLLAMYFSGSIVLQRIVSPKLPPLPPDLWREFGLLENLQNLVLLSLLVVVLCGIVRKRVLLDKVVWGAFALCTMFVLLEELDYGTHIKVFLTAEESFDWFQPMAEWSPERIMNIDLASKPVNVHNQPGVNKLFKNAGDALTFILFVLVPIIATRTRSPWARYFAPDKYAVLTVIAIVLLRYLTHTLGDIEATAVQSAAAAGNTARETGSISKNLSEFRELNFYYLLLVWCSDVVFLRHSPTEESEAQ